MFKQQVCSKVSDLLLQSNLVEVHMIIRPGMMLPQGKYHKIKVRSKKSTVKIPEDSKFDYWAD